MLGNVLAGIEKRNERQREEWRQQLANEEREGERAAHQRQQQEEQRQHQGEDKRALSGFVDQLPIEVSCLIFSWLEPLGSIAQLVLVSKQFALVSSVEAMWHIRSELLSKRLASSRMLPLTYEGCLSYESSKRKAATFRATATGAPIEAVSQGRGNEIVPCWGRHFLRLWLIASNRCLICCRGQGASNGPFAYFEKTDPFPESEQSNSGSPVGRKRPAQQAEGAVDVEREEEEEGSGPPSAEEVAEDPWWMCGVCHPCLRRFFAEKKTFPRDFPLLSTKASMATIRFFRLHRYTICVRQAAATANLEEKAKRSGNSTSGSHTAGHQEDQVGEGESPQESRPVRRMHIWSYLLQHSGRGYVIGDEHDHLPSAEENTRRLSRCKEGFFDPLHFLDWPGHRLA